MVKVGDILYSKLQKVRIEILEVDETSLKYLVLESPYSNFINTVGVWRDHKLEKFDYKIDLEYKKKKLLDSEVKNWLK